MISRRNLLLGTSIVAASAALTRKLVWADDPPPPPRAWADADLTSPDADPSLAPEPGWGPPVKILEIFLVGGLSPFESFFVDRRFMSGGLLRELETTAISASCDSTTPNGTTTQIFNDRTPMRMEWSVGTTPLWTRDDILARTRVVAMTHGDISSTGIRPRARMRSPGGASAIRARRALARQ